MTRRYPVRPKTGAMVLCALFFTLCAMFLFWEALTNQRGLVINGLIHFDAGEARVFYGVLCAASLGFVALACFALVAYQRSTPEIVLDDVGITTPGPGWRLAATRTARFADVTAIREQSINGQHFLTLVTPTQKVWIGKSLVPAGAYDEIAALVRERVAR